MEPRMTNPALKFPEVMDDLQGLAKTVGKVAHEAGLVESTADLVDIRASQINGCAVCLDMHTRAAKKHGVTDQQLHTLAAWRDSPYFDEAERAALALAEAGTRLADGADRVPDEVYRTAAKHFDEPAMVALVLRIALINTFNRLNVITGQVAGEWTARYAG